MSKTIVHQNSGNGKLSQWEKECPGCAQGVSKFDAECSHCGADIREKCPKCGLPFCGEKPTCPGFHSEEERAHFFRTSPRSKKANRVNQQPGWLRARRANVGW